ncbi:uncharacterized protein K02A2.6-like [Ylistrum balloti]|uniref:uncharacterized protein K02A2.6-like n=1 Tax=Ylistrum balloti TaxID=509963 RepID=UPI002905A210|nr:uncharacterized protein K02A2.6-like [Ylistrum balloti]
MKSEIKQMVETCEACQEMAARSTKLPIKQNDDGDKPWSKIGMDLFDIKGRQYLVTVDYYSNYIEVDYLSNVISAAVVNILKKQFARFGIPVTIISDGGPQITAREFQQFTKTWGINHVTSSPQHQRANDKAAVKVI